MKRCCMEGTNRILTCEQAREIDMVDYLSKAGFQPQRIRDHNYWYLSPLREERTASFKVNRKLNRWYDHGIGKGGNLIDFALLFHNCKLADWLRGLDAGFLPHTAPSERTAVLAESTLKISGIKKLSSPALLSYLQARNISFSTAALYCVEVAYRYHGRTYFGIGFKNDAGGYEIRNPYYKNSCSPKAITTIVNNTQKLAVFEGFFDFLSFISLTPGSQAGDYSFCILNSLSFFEKARPFLEEHLVICLFLDRDAAGRNCTKYALGLNQKYIDASSLYKGYKDLNEGWMTRKPPP